MVEDQPTFEGNARKKAEEIAYWLQSRTGILPVQLAARDRQDACPTLVLADDSGLEVDALGGEPGVLSARYAGKQGDDAGNNRKLLERLKDVPPAKRTARFRCVIAIAKPDGGVAIAEGACEGRIGFEPSGANGFGYGQTFAELGSDVKDKISHRASALQQSKSILA